MTKRQIEERATRCFAEKLCFISLKPIDPEEINFAFHDEIQDIVPISPEYGK